VILFFIIWLLDKDYHYIKSIYYAVYFTLWMGSIHSMHSFFIQKLILYENKWDIYEWFYIIYMEYAQDS